MSEQSPYKTQKKRLWMVQGIIAVAMLVLLVRMVDLHILNRDFLQGQGDARHLRVVSVPAHRGMLTDRNGEPLAISTPVQSVWANPQELLAERARWPALVKSLGLQLDSLERSLSKRKDKEFVYLRRHVQPELAEQVMELGIPGVFLQQEYRRYYPGGEVAAHVVGFTNIDDRGQEGMELLLDSQLQGVAGSKRVIRDRLGHIVENVESISEPRHGRDVALSIDRRIQYLAYRELKAAVSRHYAKSGSAVVLDVRTGEVLAMVNQPSYNPNDRRRISTANYRNRAVTDLFEPGSTMKPITAAAALESGEFRPTTMVNTSPGYMRLASYTIRDHRDYGRIDLSTIIQKSSNVGMSRVAMQMEAETLWNTYSGFGFGMSTTTGFPGEVDGILPMYQDWNKVEQATLSYGYGMSTTALQLARAYAVLAGDGDLKPVTFLRQEEEQPEGMKVISADTAAKVRAMMERVVQPGGTATKARLPGYRVAGKTGTVKKLAAGAYTEDRYQAVFAGLAPASDPRLVMVVMVDDPQSEVYYGGAVAAPVFAKVMTGAMRLLDIAPDDPSSLGTQIADAGGHVQ